MEIYLDNAATTKPRKEVVKAMLRSLEKEYGNPSSYIKRYGGRKRNKKRGEQ